LPLPLRHNPNAIVDAEDGVTLLMHLGSVGDLAQVYIWRITSTHAYDRLGRLFDTLVAPPSVCGHHPSPSCIPFPHVSPSPTTHTRTQVRALIALGANIEARDRFGETIFMRAVRDDDLALASLLVEYGANVDAANELGYNSLMLAASHNRLTMVRFLCGIAPHASPTPLPPFLTLSPTPLPPPGAVPVRHRGVQHDGTEQARGHATYVRLVLA